MRRITAILSADDVVPQGPKVHILLHSTPPAERLLSRMRRTAKVVFVKDVALIRIPESLCRFRCGGHQSCHRFLPRLSAGRSGVVEALTHAVVKGGFYGQEEVDSPLAVMLSNHRH